MRLKHRSAETNQLIGKIKYLNGGLFLQHKIEKKYNGKIKISDVAFENLLKLFKDYSWNLNDTPGGQDNELNPDVLGYIFEKYINQKAFGAYYTRTEITEYLCEQTVYKLILDAINGPEIDPELLKKAEIEVISAEDVLLGDDRKYWQGFIEPAYESAWMSRLSEMEENGRQQILDGTYHFR